MTKEQKRKEVEKVCEDEMRPSLHCIKSAVPPKYSEIYPDASGHGWSRKYDDPKKTKDERSM